MVEYAYDAFGNCSITNSTNTHLANYNPIRYRGYYFDDETGWYFLNARYYSPEWRRFISPDDTAYLNPKKVNGCNLYCYCGNDPINFVDPSGTEAYLVTIYILNFGGSTGIPIVGHSMLFFRGGDDIWYMTHYTGSFETKGKDATIRRTKIKDGSIRQFIEDNYLPKWVRSITKRLGIDKLPLDILTLGYNAVYIDGDYAGLEHIIKDGSPFNDGYDLIGNNCAHYIESVLKEHYNGRYIPDIFFTIMSTNPIPAVLDSVTKYISNFGRKVVGFWDSITN